MKRFAILLLFLFATAAGVKAQTVSPMGGIGTVQVFDNTGELDTNAVMLTTSAFYHIVWCLQNDGPFCAGSDVLASIDNVPGGASGGGGTASCGSGCVGFFISGTASPATSGVLRCAALSKQFLDLMLHPEARKRRFSQIGPHR